MKKTYLSISAAIAILLSIGYQGTTAIKNTHSVNGKRGVTGSPGENTCSQSTCHGAGAPGGLADNAGSGAVTITTNPAFVNNTYQANQTYSVTVTVNQVGCSYFGFDFEALDATKPFTSLTTNNSIGTLSTNPNFPDVSIAQYIGSKGNFNAFHNNPITTTDKAEFTFNWKAPASGTVSMYAAGNAANNDNTSDAGDNIYKTSLLNLTPATVLGVENVPLQASLNVFPNPVLDLATVSFDLKNDDNVSFSIMNTNGEIVKSIVKQLPGGEVKTTLDLSTLAKGNYILMLKTQSAQAFTKLVKK
jgi:hypothetical protein